MSNDVKKCVTKSIPSLILQYMQRLRDIALDSVDALRGRDELMPPRSLMFVGDGDFKKIGEDFKDLFIKLGQLQPDSRVLDIGCGVGRMAVPLIAYLSPSGEYQGFDIVKKGIDWCEKNITGKHPYFHFKLVDIHNKYYNPTGTCSAQDFKFPYADRHFDFAFATSVFTHMLLPSVENYLKETSRVLKEGKRALLTFFLLNVESENGIREGRSTRDFKYDMGNCRTILRENPESAVAYREEFIRTLLSRCGLEIVEPIHFGSWCGRDKFLRRQDIIIVEKKRR